MVSYLLSDRFSLEAFEARTLLSGEVVSQTTASLSLARYHPAAVTLGAQAFFVGGIGGAGPTLADDAAVDVYDGATGAWSTLTLPRPEVAHAFAVGRNLLIIGASDDGAFHTDVYHSATGQWTSRRAPNLQGGSPTQVGRFIVYSAIATSGGSPAKLARIYDTGSGHWFADKLSVSVPGDGMIFHGDSVYNLSGGANAVAIFNSHTELWSTRRLPRVGNSTFLDAVVGDHWVLDGIRSPDEATIGIGIFSPSTNRLVEAQLSQPRAGFAVEVVGSKVFFIGGSYLDANGVRQQSSVVDIYDDATGTWSVATSPQRQFALQPMARVGSKLIFCTGDFCDVYDAAANAWTTVPFSLARSDSGITTIGTKAIFAGGKELLPQVELFAPVNNVDIYTDLTPAPVLSGGLAGNSGHKAAISIFNTGDAALPTGATVGIYASATRTLDANSVLLGQATLADPLAAGSSVTVKVSTSLKDVPAGQYHLVAAVDDHSGSGPTPIASRASTFKVSAHAAGSAASTSAAHPFARRAGPLHGWPVGG